MRHINITGGVLPVGASPSLQATLPLPPLLQTIMIAADGGWRLSGFAFSVSADSFSTASAGGTASVPAPSLHSYADPYPPPWEELAKVRETREGCCRTIDWVSAWEKGVRRWDGGLGSRRKSGGYEN